MAFNVRHLPSYATIGKLAYDSGEAGARSANMKWSAEQNQRAQQFATQSALHAAQIAQQGQLSYAHLISQNQQRELDRQHDFERARQTADLTQEAQEANLQRSVEEYQAQQEIKQRAELEKNFDYLPEEQRQLQQLDSARSIIYQKQSSGEMRPDQARSALYSVEQKRRAIMPKQPKKDPWEQYPPLPNIQGGRYVAVPGRNDVPEAFNIDTGMMLKDEQQLDLDRHEQRLEEEKVRNEHALAMAKEETARQEKEAKQTADRLAEDMKRIEELKTRRTKERESLLKSHAEDLKSTREHNRAVALKRSEKIASHLSESRKFAAEHDKEFKLEEAQKEAAMIADAAYGQSLPEPVAPEIPPEMDSMDAAIALYGTDENHWPAELRAKIAAEHGAQ